MSQSKLHEKTTTLKSSAGGELPLSLSLSLCLSLSVSLRLSLCLSPSLPQSLSLSLFLSLSVSLSLSLFLSVSLSFSLSLSLWRQMAEWQGGERAWNATLCFLWPRHSFTAGNLLVSAVRILSLTFLLSLVCWKVTLNLLSLCVYKHFAESHEFIMIY